MGSEGGGLDVNNQNNISAMQTFLGNTEQLRKNSNKTIGSLFTEADENKSKSLDKNEIAKVLKEWNMDKIFTTDAVLSAVDKDSNGQVTMEEIKAYAQEMGVNFDENTTLASVLGSISGLGGGLGQLVGKLFGNGSAKQS